MPIILALILISILVYIALKKPFVGRRSRKGHRALKQVFKGVVKRHMLSVAEVNRFGNRLIAIDRNRAKLVLIVYKNDITWERCLDLNELMFCQIVKTMGKTSNAIQDVSMELTLRNSLDRISFPFFDGKLDLKRGLSYRLKKAHYWKKMIQFQLSLRQLRTIRRSDADHVMF